MNLICKACLLVLTTALLIYSQPTNIRVSSPGSNDPEEVTIAINPLNPNYLAAGANIRYFYRSSDGGLTWIQSTMSSSLGVWGDPCVLYDGLGNLYFAHLSNPITGYWIDRIVVQKSTNNGVTWNDGAGIGYTYPRNQDKEWLAVDMHSQYKHNLYTSWTEFDNYGSFSTNDSSRILFARSTDHGITWSSTVRISDKGGNCIDSDNTVEGAVPTVGLNGEIYVSWAGPLGLLFDKSTDGGVTFGVDKFVSDMPGGWDFAVPGIYRCNGLPVTACDTSRSPFRGNIYICWGDQRNGTSNSDVFLMKSTDGGDTWGPRIKVNDDNTDRHQFFPWMTIDQTTGIIYVVFYDRRNTTGAATDVYMAKSTNGGDSFENFKISESSFTPNASIFFGDYINVAALNRKVYPIWTRMDGTAMSIWTAIYSDTSSVVPVELANFQSIVDDGKIILSWETITEKNNFGFEIQRRSENEKNDFHSIGFLNGKGTTTEKQFYSFIDNPLEASTYYYRLKQVDLNGAFEFSNQLEVNFNNAFDFSLAQNYPNPFNPKTTISYTLPRSSFISLKVFDLLGNEITTLVNEIKPAGTHEIDFNADKFSSGIYFYTLSAGDFSETRKMIIAK